jgi:hypothetical protein
VDIERNVVPDWLIAIMLGQHWPRSCRFTKEHPEIAFTASHMILDFFNEDSDLLARKNRQLH